MRYLSVNLLKVGKKWIVVLHCGAVCSGFRDASATARKVGLAIRHAFIKKRFKKKQMLSCSQLDFFDRASSLLQRGGK